MTELAALTELPFGLAGRVYRSPMPFGRYDPAEQVFDLYRQHAIQVVVALPESYEMLAITGRDLLSFYRQQGLVVHHCPAPDFGVPSPETLRQAVAAVYQAAQQGCQVVVHCHAGIGRTGLVLACLARQVFGFSGDEAIAWARQAISGAVETEAQCQAVRQYGLREFG